MKTCNSFSELRQFGIRFLTGEADALSFRILCDLDEQGKRVFCELYGIPRDAALAHGWNDGVASVMLTQNDVIPLSIIGFYLQGYDVVISQDEQYHQSVFALESNERVELNEEGCGYNFIQKLPYPVKENSKDHVTSWPKCYGNITKIIRQQKSDGRVVQGTRNVHQFTGRVS
jgi:hypothetical protein